nr:PREDICTED: troponin T isoform X5 [Bemisia tabaci]
MSDEEDVYSESEEETQPEPEPQKKTEADGGDPEFVKRQEAKSSALDEQLKEYIAEWRKQRSKEEEDLKKLKEKQAKRKVMRAEEEKRMAERKKQEEERRQREVEEKKQRDIEEKRRRLEEAEKKRQAMMAALKVDQSKNKGPNFTIAKKADPGMSLSSAQLERNKTKEQIEEEKKISLSFRIKPLNLEGYSIHKLQAKATELWETIVKLETEKYDLEERQKRQDYDLKELKERQKQQLRHKALKKGLDPEALTGKYPPKIQVASKYERRVDTRSYDDKKQLFEGGWENTYAEFVEYKWQEKQDRFAKRKKTKLPKWFGERPGKKKGEPESPEEEEVKKDDEDADAGGDDEEEEEVRHLLQIITTSHQKEKYKEHDEKISL